MIRKIRYLAFIAITIALSACSVLDNCLEGEGAMTSEERLGGIFTAIECEGDFFVQVDSATTTSVEVTTDRNLLRYIETTVQNGILVISTSHPGCVNYSPGTVVRVSCPNLSSISLLGSGNVEVFNFKANQFTVNQIGSGDINISGLSVTEDIEVNLIGSGNVWLKGRAQEANYVLSGSGNIDAEAMRIFDCAINLSGSGNIHTYVYDTLRAIISGSGNVYYYGNTKEVIKRITGSGDVFDRSLGFEL